MLMELRVAREWKVRPSELRRWSRRDTLLAYALLRHENSVGPCGLPHSQTTGDMEGWYEVDDSVVCWACAALSQYHKDHEKDMQPGAQLRVIDTHPTEE